MNSGKIAFVGFCISGKITSAGNLKMLERLVKIAGENGWGVAAPAQTPGDQHVLFSANRFRVTSIGVFTNKVNNPNLRGGAVSKEIDEYSPEEVHTVRALYESMGKSIVWEFLPYERKMLFVSLVALVRVSHAIAIWPGDVTSNICAQICGAMRRKIYYLPKSEMKFIQYFLDNKR